MDTMVVVALGAYLVLLCTTIWVIKIYNDERGKIDKRLKLQRNQSRSFC
jgi:hypothetical protein